MENRSYGYARVSTTKQSTDRQVEKLIENGIEERFIFVDKMSGKNFERPQYQVLKNALRENDTLYLVEFDRIGRSYQEIKNEWEYITKTIKADIVVLDMPILDTRQHKDLLGTFISDLVLSLLSYVSTNEREKINNRVRSGLEMAKKHGTKSGRPFGRPKIEKPKNFDETVDKVKNGNITAREAMKTLGLKTNTYYSMVKKYKK